MSQGAAAPLPPETRVTLAAERVVQIAAARALVDQARHLLDGAFDACRVCGAPVRPSTAVVDGTLQTEMVTDHDETCPVLSILEAQDALASAAENDI